MVTANQKTNFYNKVRPMFTYGLAQSQVDGIEAIINEYNKRSLSDARMLAYILATVHHETGGTFLAIEEGGKGAGHPYGQKFKMGDGPGKRIAYTTPNQLYYGRGLVQITWYENYEAFGRLLKIDLLNHPDLALDMNIAVQILFEGMLRGMFTGVSLSHYFTSNNCDFINARHIINGTDCAEKIAWTARRFSEALA